MAIPALNRHGILPPGIHDSDIYEFMDRFCINPNRQEIWSGFLDFIHWFKNLNITTVIYLDGSYATDKIVPKDIDVVVDVSDGTDDQLGAAFSLFATKQAWIKETYKVDFWFYHPASGNDLRLFFQYLRNEECEQRGLTIGSRKGIIRVVI